MTKCCLKGLRVHRFAQAFLRRSIKSQCQKFSISYPKDEKHEWPLCTSPQASQWNKEGWSRGRGGGEKTLSVCNEPWGHARGEVIERVLWSKSETLRTVLQIQKTEVWCFGTLRNQKSRVNLKRNTAVGQLSITWLLLDNLKTWLWEIMTQFSYTLQTIICKYLKQLTSCLKTAFQSLLCSHLYLRQQHKDPVHWLSWIQHDRES